MARKKLLLETAEFHRFIHVDKTGRYEQLVPIRKLVIIDNNKYTPAHLKAKNIARNKPKLIGIKMPVIKKKKFSLKLNSV